MDLDLAGRRVLVSGASGKLGSAIAATFGAEGAQVAVAYRSNEAAATETARAVEAAGGTAITVALDLAATDSLSSAVGTVVERFGGLDVLVNNAVAWPGRRPPTELFEEAPIELMQNSVATTVVGQYALSQAAVAAMRPGGWGRVVHVSTSMVEVGQPRSAAYTTPKSALHGLTRTMSRELAPVGILTNTVMAGFVPGPEVPAPILERASAAAAIGRASNPQEIANLIVFLCSGANTNVTGEWIRADGDFWM